MRPAQTGTDYFDLAADLARQTAAITLAKRLYRSHETARGRVGDWAAASMATRHSWVYDAAARLRVTALQP